MPFGSYDGQLYWGHDDSVGEDGAVYATMELLNYSTTQLRNYATDVHLGMCVRKFVPKERK